MVPLAQAQNVPRPAEFYFDQDATATRALSAQRGEGDALVNRLIRQIERDPRAWEAMAQLGQLAMDGGREDTGRGFYDRAIAGAGAQHGASRRLRWHYGWSLYRSGDAQAALTQWASLIDGPLRAQWLPPTMALALWKLDHKDQAVAWYAAAARTEPSVWASPTDLAALLPDWREQERADLLEVQRAWAANPPAWP
ncbi:MAG: tetratricopeptide repeat protein [Pseudomonadota bacterium]|nr:tetratricopeptide repeat protein [Pseudomonadota bacterium]